jgi:hypothetical protein
MGDDIGEAALASLAALSTQIDALSGSLAGIEHELRLVRAAIDDVADRLDDGLVLADDVAGPVAQLPEGALDEVRADLLALKRRITLRAGDQALTAEQLEQIAEAVAQRLAPVVSRQRESP